MSYALDTEYINKISYKLRNFKWKSSNLANFSCPICGDSTKKKNKARGFFVYKNDRFIYKCHNCTAPPSFQNFLKDVAPEEYKQYVIDSLKEQGKYREPVKKTTSTVEQIFGSKSGLVHIATLDYNHPARKYIRDRKIPTNDVYHVEQFFTWGSEQFPQKFQPTIIDHPRIIFPAYDEHRNIIGYSCRAYNGEEPKYYTLKLVDDFVFGINRIDKTKPIYVVEGGVDSMFLPNCVAVCTSALHMVKGLDDCKKILVPDNQPRNSEICKLVKKFIDLGFDVVIWPDNIQGKDINDLILAGYTSEMIVDIINKSTYSGLVAMAKFNQWRKV